MKHGTQFLVSYPPRSLTEVSCSMKTFFELFLVQHSCHGLVGAIELQPEKRDEISVILQLNKGIHI